MKGGNKMSEKTRINIAMPNELHDFVKFRAKKLGIPISTMYVIIVNQFKANEDNLRTLENLQNFTRMDK